mgnify:CR=1|tara:strand:- start:263 stop:820 length:558 start_codon:yes stop_codon:yes gene_type:complete
MKNILLSISIILVFGCSSGETEKEQNIVEKITTSDTIFTLDSLSKTGFKKNKTYNVEKLPNADSAYFGWKKFGSDGPKDFEIRFYKSHTDAIEYGKSYADEATGEDAIITKSNATWKEGIKDRRLISTPTDGGSIGAAIGSNSSPKYADYIIYGNMIILCEGWDSDESLERCSNFISGIISNDKK